MMAILWIILALVSYLVFLFFKNSAKIRHRQQCYNKFPKPDLTLPNLLFQFVSDSKGNFETVLSLCRMSERFIMASGLGFYFAIIYKPSDVERVLSSNVHISKSMEYEYLQPWLGLGLLTSSGPRWRKHRKILTPTFHFKILEDFLDVFNRNGEILCDKLEQQVGKEPFNIYNHVKLAALDNIYESAMGINMHVQENQEPAYVQAVTEACASTAARMLKKWFIVYPLYRFSHYYSIQQKALKVLHDNTDMVIRQRREEYKKRRAEPEKQEYDDINQKRKLAFLDLLLESVDAETMTNKDIREEIDTFMFEGHDTVSSGLSFILYNLARHQDCQEKAYQELEEIFQGSDRKPTMKDLNEMKYLDQCVKESQRLYPSVPFIGRKLEEDLELDGGYVVPESSQCIIAIHHLHRDPEIFPNPEVFNPEHFSPDNCQKRHPYAYIPFSAGPRNCIGQRFAVMEMKATVSKILRRFKILPSQWQKHDIQLTMELVLKSANGIHVTLESRN